MKISFFGRLTFPALKNRKAYLRKHKRPQSRVFFGKVWVIVCVGFPMKCSCVPCWDPCHTNTRHFCTCAPGSCLTVSFDQTHPPGPRITEETLLREDRPAESATSARGWQQSVWPRGRSAWTQEPRTARKTEEGGVGFGVGVEGGVVCGSRWFVWTFGLTSHYSKRM